MYKRQVFQVDQAVADVIRRFHQVDQRVACPALRFQLRQLELGGDLLEQRQLALVAAELVFLVALGVGMARRPGVLEVGAKGGVGQPRAAVELVILELGEYAKALGIALEIEKVGCLLYTSRCV